MGLHYFPFWIEPWWKDYKVQSLPRNVRLIFYDILALLWDRDMRLENDDHAVSHYLRITPEEWVDAKRILVRADLIQLVQANKRIECYRLGMEYERIMEAKYNRTERARKGGISKARKRNDSN